MKPSPQSRFSRHQVMELTGVQEGALGFWVKEGVLTAVEGGEGRGSHRRFSAMQVSAIGLIKELQSYGVNVQQLKSFGRLLEEGIRAVEACGLHPSSLVEAVYLAKDLARFAAGDSIKVYKKGDDQVTSAKSQIDIIDSHLPQNEYEDLRQNIIDYALGVAERDPRALRLAHIVYHEMYGDNGADYSILLWRGNNGEWEFADSTEPGDQFTPLPQSRPSGIFMGVGVIVRQIWSIDLEERARRGRMRYLVDVLARNPEQFDKVVKLGRFSDKDLQAARKLSSKAKA